MLTDKVVRAALARDKAAEAREKRDEAKKICFKVGRIADLEYGSENGDHMVSEVGCQVCRARTYDDPARHQA